MVTSKGAFLECFYGTENKEEKKGEAGWELCVSGLKMQWLVPTVHGEGETHALTLCTTSQMVMTQDLGLEQGAQGQPLGSPGLHQLQEVPSSKMGVDVGGEAKSPFY